uniref:Secretoglobin family 3A member 2 n=1 Tax=Macaca fascicularis TaxID=9541 RepID=G7P8L7_MACFA
MISDQAKREGRWAKQAAGSGGEREFVLLPSGTLLISPTLDSSYPSEGDLEEIDASLRKTTAFLFNKAPLPDDKLVPLPLDNIPQLMDPLKLLLKTLGISVEHLLEGLKKCVNELGPEASEAVKKLLEALSHLV